MIWLYVTHSNKVILYSPTLMHLKHILIQKQEQTTWFDLSCMIIAIIMILTTPQIESTIQITQKLYS